MIFASFEFNFVRPASGGNTSLARTIDLDFRSLYQINPEHLVVLGYASITGMRRDIAGGTLPEANELIARLIGNFNETFNVIGAIVAPRTGDTLVPFNGIAINQGAPFIAPPNSQILMPPTFQIEFGPSGFIQTATNDSFKVFFSIGYEIVMKRTRF